MTKIISLNDICFEVNASKLLTNISFDISTHEILAIVGPNGASKTTLLKVLSGELPPSSGCLNFLDKPMHEWPLKKLAKQLAVLPQLSLLNFPYTAEEVVSLGRTPHDTGIAIDHAIVSDAMSLCNITYLKHRDYTRLSGGEKQRVQLARVFAQIWQECDREGSENYAGDSTRPERVLLLDEPTSALDLGHQQQLMTALQQLKESGVAIVIVVHDLNVAATHADKIVALSCGNIHYYGDTSGFLNAQQLSALFNAKISIINDESNRKVIVL